METAAEGNKLKDIKRRCWTDGKPFGFQMPLHYPRYSKAEYESMAEWILDKLFQEYGLAVVGDVEYKRNFAMGAFLWPHHSP
ncbi:hypothetical protein SUGI_0326360 [Cryptomeria japonica]|nr:hypothetical protein SUGI_0326360 [Cryptomeria japonica]